MPLTIEVFGLPAPQGSKTIYRGRMVEASAKKLNPWRKAIAEAVHQALPADHEILLGPIEAEIWIYLPRPPSIKRNKREHPIVPPDTDKIVRGILDGIGQGLNGKSGDGMYWGDDSQVVNLHAYKRYADDREPGATIRLTAL
jgi:Holliday junction resolvase RusA-like endonuclease